MTNSVTVSHSGAQPQTATVAGDVRPWLPASEEELDLIRIVLSYPLSTMAVRNDTRPLTRHDFRDSVLGAAYGVVCELLSRQQAVTLKSILATLSDWANDPNALNADDEKIAAVYLPQIAQSGPPLSLNRTSAVQELRRLASAIHTRNDDTLSEAETENRYRCSTGADLASRITATKWLWPSYIPRGYVTLLVADQDMGKSGVALDFCRTVISGKRWPDGKPNVPVPDARMLWIDTEGAIALWYERALAWGVPVDQFIFPADGLQELRIDDAAAWEWIEQTIEIFKPPLVIVDSLSGAHTGKENDADEMKKICKKLARLASETGVAMVVIHHLNKAANGVPDYPVNLARSRGSSAITQFCRSVLALGVPDKSRPEHRRLDVIKLNLAKKPAAVGYFITDDGPAWGEAPEPPKDRRPVDEAIDFLEVALKDGPRLSDDVQEEATAQGISYRAFNDAKKAMGVKSRKEGTKADGGARWFLYSAEHASRAQEH